MARNQGGLASVLLLLFCTQGCALRNTHDRGAELELEIARLRAAAQAERVADLEARLAKVEQSAAAPADDREVLDRLEQLIELNRGVLLRAAELVPETEPLPAPETWTADHTSICDPNLAPTEQLQRLVTQIRGRRTSWRGGLSSEEMEALRVLLRPERPLDASNPW